MNYIITVGIAIIFAIFATAATMPLAGDAPPVGAILFGSFCGGLYVGRFVSSALKYKPKLRRPRNQLDATPTRPFSERLRTFSHGDDRGDTVERLPETSRMPFWMLDTTHDRTPPKTASFIRRILYRIRSVLTSGNG
ncbi:hypothetical protein [Stieleria varia]|uniref:Uncharacterized protein n=1 Tax=Stieleria varia TaxID=2528005 RepID=A0A5C6B3A1_9BACT|nr:hypothetical protein [Stieleria varia]TWU05849.1 hypothetical protein Pla52n_15640 [Stieleria varia]